MKEWFETHQGWLGVIAGWTVAAIFCGPVGWIIVAIDLTALAVLYLALVIESIVERVRGKRRSYPAEQGFDWHHDRPLDGR